MFVSLVETSTPDKKNADTFIHSIKIYAGKDSDGKLLYETNGKRYLEVMKKTLSWCKAHSLSIHKIYFTDGSSYTNNFQHSFIMDTAFDKMLDRSKMTGKSIEKNN